MRIFNPIIILICNFSKTVNGLSNHMVCKIGLKKPTTI